MRNYVQEVLDFVLKCGPTSRGRIREFIAGNNAGVEQAIDTLITNGQLAPHGNLLACKIGSKSLINDKLDPTAKIAVDPQMFHTERILTVLCRIAEALESGNRIDASVGKILIARNTCDQMDKAVGDPELMEAIHSAGNDSMDEIDRAVLP